MDYVVRSSIICEVMHCSCAITLASAKRKALRRLDLRFLLCSLLICPIQPVLNDLKRHPGRIWRICECGNRLLCTLMKSNLQTAASALVAEMALPNAELQQQPSALSLPALSARCRSSMLL
eukprot:5485351-Pleurochrysis_carterae.AAC.4